MSPLIPSVGGAGTGPWTFLARSRPGRPPPAETTVPTGAESSAIVAASPLASSAWGLLSSGSAIKGPRDVNGNGRLDASEIRLWQEEQESGRLAWLMLMLARAAVDRLRSEGGPTVRAEKLLSEGFQSFDQGDLTRAMTLAARVRAEAGRALDRIRRQEEREEEEDHWAEFPGLREKEMEKLLGQDQEPDRIDLEQLQGLMNLVHELNRQLGSLPPPEYVETTI
ncbi:MAG: hypothetical protein KKC37_16870 [Proteobacteria bacterium]|nr:hypothetical protein [Pseudomonadota bacterium]